MKKDRLNELEYNGLKTEVRYDSENHLLYGDLKSASTNECIGMTFEANSIESVEEEFHKAVDTYTTPSEEFKAAFESLNQIDSVNAYCSNNKDYIIGILNTCGDIDSVLFDEIFKRLTPYICGIKIDHWGISNTFDIVIYVRTYLNKSIYRKLYIKTYLHKEDNYIVNLEKIASEKNIKYFINDISDSRIKRHLINFVNLESVGKVEIEDPTITRIAIAKFYRLTTDEIPCYSLCLESDEAYNRLQSVLTDYKINFEIKERE